MALNQMMWSALAPLNSDLLIYCGQHGSLKPISGGGLSACFGDTVFPAVPLSIAAFAFIGIWGDTSWKKGSKASKKSNKDKKVKLHISKDDGAARLSGSAPGPSKALYITQVAICAMAMILSLVTAAAHRPMELHHVTASIAYALLWATYLFHVRRAHRKSDEGVNSFVIGSAALCAIVAIFPLAGNGNSEWFHFSDVTGLVCFIAYTLQFLVAAAFLGTLLFQRANRSHLSRDSAAEDTSAQQWERINVVFRYVWPVNSVALQARVLLCLALLLVGRIVNVVVPLAYKRLIGALGTGATPFGLVLVYAAALLVQGGGGNSNGLVSNLRSYLWIPVGQNTDKSLKVALYDHLLHLPLSWHLSRKTGEVFRSMDRGTDSIANLLTTVLFNLMPAIADIVIAVGYFAIAFDALFGVIVLYTMVSFLVWTIVVSDFRTSYRKKQNEKDKAARGVSVDAMLNFETVKYFGNESYETRGYADVVQDYQRDEYMSTVGNCTLNVGQSVILSIGGLAGMALCAYRVGQGQLAAGDFVLFVTYMAQLASPLTGFGNYWRQIQTYMVDARNMFELLEHKGEVNDVLGAKPLHITGGAQVEFKDVSFSYGSRLILDNISFVIPAHKTYALVGESGGGKSTIIRLLFRFYDVSSGAILIDGQDVAKVTQKSLRQHIGVVPQDTVLFHETVMYNIRYGKLGATDDEVYAAAQSAELHDRILSFEDEYETIVGERGLRLSGGEKQRVAIARTMLKAPAIVLLDEATSALDTNTEKNIQASLRRVCANRTTLIVAHRLSTIIHADCIMVVDQGRIVERGTHEELLQQGGAYHAMWERQQKKETSEDLET